MYVDDIKLAGKKQNMNPTWKILMKDADLGEPTSSHDHVYLGCTQRECQISKDIADNYRSMFESRLSAGATEKFQKRYLHGPMIWKVMQRSAWNDFANWQIKQRNNYTKSQHHALTTTKKKKMGELSKVCSHVYIWLVLVDLIFYGP